MKLPPEFKREILEYLPHFNIAQVKVTMDESNHYFKEIQLHLEDGRTISLSSVMHRYDDSAIDVEMY